MKFEGNNDIGIYKITNIITNKVYIGSSLLGFKRRKRTHLFHLLHKTHHSKKLQNSFNKYGKDNFVFEEVEKCDKKNILEREQHWIDFYDSYNKGYNCTPIAGNCEGREVKESTRIKISNSLKGRKTGRTLSKEEFAELGKRRRKPIYQYDSYGKLINRYEWVGELFIDPSDQSLIRMAIRKGRKSKGFYWSYGC